MKKVLILGGSVLQIPLIKTAKKLNLYVIVVDMYEKAEGFKYADEKYYISTIDDEKIIELFRTLKPDGILTAATDLPMRTIAKVGELFDVNTISYNSAINSTDKYQMRSKLDENNVPIPKYYVANTKSEYLDSLEKIDGNKICKPVDSSGSKGVILIENRESAEEAFLYAKKYSKSGKILVEEQMVGSEVSVESITINGKTKVIAITDKITTGSPYFTEMGHSIHSQLPYTIKGKIEQVTIKAIEALGITMGPTHTELIITSEGPKIVEVGARLGGDFITSHLVKYATGIDLLELHLKQSVGYEIEDSFNIKNYGAAIKYFENSNGVLRDIIIPEYVYDNENLIEIAITGEFGSEISEVSNSNSRIGHVICSGENSKQALVNCERILKDIKIEID
ncbi:ATP-grasp domain-containing protein [Staphylococcus shinii]|uniref:ATP-grasp domain-containing protein n=1 Tax=Staphylococcus shinii TaxID=2912228 RepID=UPI001304CCCF|nr:ATP-grasp domain-containing protein [Staphylococcus shinii]